MDGHDYLRMKTSELEALMSDADRRMVAESRGLPWERVDEDRAETPAGREALHRMAVSGMHRDEWEMDRMCECMEDDDEGDDW